jgi:multidrug efflux pump subunit AcrB
MQILIVLVGVSIFPTFPKLEDPSIIIREVVITTSFPGMPTDRVDRLITRPIEEEIRTMGVVDDIYKSSCKIRSTSKFGESIIHVTVKDDIPSKELTRVWRRFREKMNDIKAKLPSGTIGPVVNDEFGDTAVATIAILSDGFSMAQVGETARDTREKLITLPGIKKIELYGVQDERIYVVFSSSKMAALGIDPEQIAKALSGQNVLVSGGALNLEGTELLIETSGTFKNLDEVGELLVATGETGSGAIALRDIATIRRGYVDPPVRPVYYNGQEAVVLSVCLLPGVDAVTFGGKLLAKLKEIEHSLPWGYRFELATYQPDLIKASVNNMVVNVIGSLIIVLVVVVILLGLRTGLIVGFFIPLVMLSGLILMKCYGIEMQRLSLAAMIIALGMLVDNGICVAEEITTRMQMGVPRREAVLESGHILAVPLLTSTLTTVFAFCPMFLQEGAAGDYTKSLGAVITILLLASWVLSMISTTSACNCFMKVAPLPKNPDGSLPDLYTGKIYKIYRAVLVWMLGHRLTVIMVIAGTLLLSFYAFRYVPKTFFPPGDRNQYLVYLDFSAGTRIEETDATTRKIARWLQDKKINPDVTSTVAYVGSGGPRFYLSLSPDDPESNYAFIIVNTESNRQVDAMAAKTRRYLLDEIPNVRGRVKPMWLGSTETGLLEIRLYGPDKDLLLSMADELQNFMRAIPGTVDIRQDWNNRVGRLKVDVDQNRAQRSGVNTQEIAAAMDFFISGKPVGDYYYGYANIPIVARGSEAERNAGDRFYTMGIYSKGLKRHIALTQIADIYLQGEYDRIKRYNQEYTVTVSGKNTVMTANDLFRKIAPALDKMDFPAGHGWAVGGEIEESGKSQLRLAKWFPICFLGIVVLLVWQFNSFRRAAIIVLTIPLVFVGAVIGMLVMDADFGFMVILGLLSLAGSIVNNGIVLIDRIETYRNEGIEPYEAILKTCVNRLRPIFLSVSTTALGILTLIYPYNPLFYGMACVIVFGLLIGSVFTLGFVPVLYAVLFGIAAPPRRVPVSDATSQDHE